MEHSLRTFYEYYLYSSSGWLLVKVSKHFNDRGVSHLASRVRRIINRRHQNIQLTMEAETGSGCTSRFRCPFQEKRGRYIRPQCLQKNYPHGPVIFNIQHKSTSISPHFYFRARMVLDTESFRANGYTDRQIRKAIRGNKIPKTPYRESVYFVCRRSHFIKSSHQAEYKVFCPQTKIRNMLLYEPSRSI